MRKGVFLKKQKTIVNVGNSIKREENMKYVGDTLAIRQSYDSHTQIIRYSIVRHTPKCLYTFQIRQTYVTSTLLMRYQYASCTVHIHASISPAYDQRINSA